MKLDINEILWKQLLTTLTEAKYENEGSLLLEV